jgi:hypothetical protein
MSRLPLCAASRQLLLDGVMSWMAGALRMTTLSHTLFSFYLTKAWRGKVQQRFFSAGAGQAREP